MRFWYFFSLLWNVFVVALLGIFGRFHGVFFLRVTLWQIIAESSLNLRYRSALILVRLLLLDSSCHPWLTADEAVTAVWPLLFDVRWHISLSWLTTSLCPALPSLSLSQCEGQLSSTRGCWFIFMPRKELNRLAHSPTQLPHHIISSPDLMNFKWCGNFSLSLFFSFFLFLFPVIRHHLLAHTHIFLPSLVGRFLIAKTIFYYTLAPCVAEWI